MSSLYLVVRTFINKNITQQCTQLLPIPALVQRKIIEEWWAKNEILHTGAVDLNFVSSPRFVHIMKNRVYL